MLNGKSFRLNVDTPGIESLPRKRVAVQVPAGSIVTVEAAPAPSDRSMILANWNGRRFEMFLADFHERCEQVTELEQDSCRTGIITTVSVQTG